MINFLIKIEALRSKCVNKNFNFCDFLGDMQPFVSRIGPATNRIYFKIDLKCKKIIMDNI